jgi:hypothetical protein
LIEPVKIIAYGWAVFAAEEKRLSGRVLEWPVGAIAAMAVAGLAATVVFSGVPIDPAPVKESANVTVIYVGADDCAPCRNWRHEHWPKFQASAEFARLIYREVTSPQLFDLMKDEYWPEDLRGHRNALDRTAGVPLWLIVADDGVALRARGLRQWEDVALPAIKSLVR